jgi:hypothetical protein
MRKSLVLVWLAAAVGVFANNNAAPFELLWYYTAYKIDFKSGRKTLASGCKPHRHDASFDTAAAAAGVQGICTFDEFVQHVAQNDRWENFHTDQPLDPDEKMVKTLFDAYAGKYPATAVTPEEPGKQWRLNMANLLPHNTHIGTGPTDPLGPALQEVLKTIQASRSLAPGDTTIQGWVDKGASFASIATQYRQKDQNTVTRKWFRRSTLETIKWFAGEAAFESNHAITYSDGTKIGVDVVSSYDWDKIKKSPRFKESGTTETQARSDLATALVNFEKGLDWNGKTADVTSFESTGNKNHVVLVQTFAAATTQMRASPPARCA